MVRLFHVYYPLRTLVLFAGEALVVAACFLLSTFLLSGPDTYLVLNYENGIYKIAAITLMAMLCAYYLDLYAPEQLISRAETYVRQLVVVATMAFILAGIGVFFPNFVLRQGVFFVGLSLLTFALPVWRRTYGWIVRAPFLRERVYVLGAGERARSLVAKLRERNDLGMEVIGWAGAMGEGGSREELEHTLSQLREKQEVDRVIVAMSERRGKLPTNELLDMRLSGVKVEEATTLLEKASGRIDLDGLQPSMMIFSEGFKVNEGLLLARRLVSLLMALSILVICLPFIPLIALAIKLTSPGPVFFRQDRVGKRGRIFKVVKFRTMRQDAEAKTGATWAVKGDPRITKIGKFLRKTRLDEIPQLWNVLTGDMGFVGPRPERPEFVQWLAEAIPYYPLRHIIRPGLTGWAQVRYEYGASLEQSKEKLEYDLYYIKHMSVSLDLLITFQTLKTVLFGKGAR